jgi:signal transduction histidine kinase
MFVLLTAVASYLLAGFVVRPVRRLQSAGHKVAEGDLSVRVAHTVGSRTDEIAQLARDFDGMTARVETLLQSQQQLMRDVSHELRSPLARLQALLSIAEQRSGVLDEGLINGMETELVRLDKLIGEILNYARLENRRGIQRRPTNIVDLVQNIVDDASLEAQAASKQIRLECPEQLVLNLDAGLIQSAVENVVRNAVKLTRTTVNVVIWEEDLRVHIVVEDDGPGVAPKELDRILLPFYRIVDSRGAHSGSGGLGLAIAERSVRAHGGMISAENRNDAGLRVDILLPCI